MPIYEYECGSCGRRFDELQRIVDDPLKVDPECGGTVRRVIQPVGIIFKGSGFYVTDSRKSSSASSGAGDNKSESKSEGKSDSSESKGESKSESKSESKGESSSSTSKSSTSDSKTPATAAAK